MPGRTKRATPELPPYTYRARWVDDVVWPRVLVRGIVEEREGHGMLAKNTRHHLTRANTDVTLGVRNVGCTTWQTLQLGRGEIFFRPRGLPAQQFHWQASESIELTYVFFDPAELPLASRAFIQPDTIYKLVDPLLGPLMESLRDAARRHYPGSHPLVEAASTLLCLQVGHALANAMPASSPGALSTTVLRRVCEHVERHLGTSIRLSDLARVAEMSASHFVRAFKASTGETPARFVQRRRIVAGQELLQTTTKPIAEIAAAVGFASQSRFTIAFRAFAGDSPLRFRRRSGAA